MGRKGHVQVRQNVANRVFHCVFATAIKEPLAILLLLHDRGSQPGKNGMDLDIEPNGPRIQRNILKSLVKKGALWEF